MTWMQTFTGRKFSLLNPTADDVDIEDIAHALSNICRFNGHVMNFYSVAQHSVIVSRFVAPENALWGLLHDAHEAYVGDVIRPMKAAVLSEFLESGGVLTPPIEHRVQAAVVKKFGLTWPPPKNVKVVDRLALATESRDVMGGQRGGDWEIPPDVLPIKIKPWSPCLAKRMFLDRFAELTK